MLLRAEPAKRVSRLTFATVTPFLASGEVDTAAVTAHVEWLKRQGVSSIIAGGTTGEFAGLSAGDAADSSNPPLLGSHATLACAAPATSAA